MHPAGAGPSETPWRDERDLTRIPLDLRTRFRGSDHLCTELRDVPEQYARGDVVAASIVMTSRREGRRARRIKGVFRLVRSELNHPRAR